MKFIQYILFLSVVLVFSNRVLAQDKKTEKVTFKVYGNCSQCKDRIETACDVKGVRTAEWDIDTKVMTIVYVPSKITLEQIHEIIANCGHDTELKKAPDAVYQKLPHCCLYREKPNTHHD